MSVSSSTRQCLVEQHCWFVVPTDSDGCFKSIGSWLKPAVLSKPTLSVHSSNWQCCRNHHCRFMAQASNVEQANTIGLLLTGNDGYDNNAGLLLTGSDGYANTIGLLLTGSEGLFAFYCFIIYFNLYFLWNRVSLYIRYVDNKSINIKHYKCYGYSSNVLIKISIPENKKEIIQEDKA